MMDIINNDLFDDTLYFLHGSLDMMDRVEAPSITDGYGLSLAFLAMLDVTRCVQVQLNPLNSLYQP